MIISTTHKQTPDHTNVNFQGTKYLWVMYKFIEDSKIL